MATWFEATQAVWAPENTKGGIPPKVNFRHNRCDHRRPGKTSGGLDSFTAGSVGALCDDLRRVRPHARHYTPQPRRHPGQLRSLLALHQGAGTGFCQSLKPTL